MGSAAYAAGDSASASREVSRARASLDETTKRYAAAQAQLAVIDDRLALVSARFSEAEQRFNRAQGALSARAASAYRRGGTDMVSLLISSKDPADLASRASYLHEISRFDAGTIQEAQASWAWLGREMSKLQAERKARAGTARQLDALRVKLAADMNRLSRLSVSARTSRSSYQGRVVGSIACPVKPPYSYTDSWGAPRSGGRRRHKGTDIMNPMGNNLLAAANGRVIRRQSGGAGGNMLYIRGDDGNEYFYAHLSGYDASAPPGARVSAGQTVGYNGNTGDARGGPPHLHFEIHPGGSGAINPYPWVRKACG